MPESAIRHAGSPGSRALSALEVESYYEVSARQAADAAALGIPGRLFFPHEFVVLPKCGPDGFKLAERMCQTKDPNDCREVILYAAPGLAARFPAELFLDDEIVWHQQQFGRPGQVASANLVNQGRDIYTMVHISDLVQRISRRREWKTQVENRFKGWHIMLLHALLHIARSQGSRYLYSSTAEWARRHTDPARDVQDELFDRIYDRDVHRLFDVEQIGNWWRLDVSANAAGILTPTRKTKTRKRTRTICICHDIERGLGHLGVDPDFARAAESSAPAALRRMLEAEKEAGIRTTYDVVGCLIAEVREAMEDGGHTLAFHSFDHDTGDAGSALTRWVRRAMGRAPSGHTNQLGRCRQVDYRIKGYRPPRSRLTAELVPANLCRHNFEWIASSASSLGIQQPRMHDRLVWIPILFDDFDLYKQRLPYADWERDALQRIEEHDFVAFGLHDCYAEHWLPGYGSFLDKVKQRGILKTLDQVAAEVTLAHAE